MGTGAHSTKNYRCFFAPDCKQSTGDIPKPKTAFCDNHTSNERILLLFGSAKRSKDAIRHS